MNIRIFAILLALIGVALTVPAQAELIPVVGDVYRFKSGAHYSLVVVTGSGVVVVDPLSHSAARELKSSVHQITNEPITHLIYSHSHFDHAAGGGTLGASTVIAHANAPNTLDGVVPTVRFTDTKIVHVGAKSLELTWLGEGHGKDLIAVVVRPENVAFVVDVITPRHLPYSNIPGGNIDAVIDQIKNIERLDFQYLAGGHGQIVGAKADAALYRGYLETLRRLVQQGLDEGKTVDELVQSVTMSRYRNWQQFDAWRESNVRGMSRYLKSL